MKRNAITVQNLATGLALTGDDQLIGAGGVQIPSLALNGTLVLVEPKLFGLDEDDHPGVGSPLPLSFGTSAGDLPVMRLAVSLAHVEPGTYLTAFESETLSNRPQDWETVDGSFEITAAHKADGYLPIELDGRPNTKFVKLVLSTYRIDPDTTLADLGE